MVPEINWHLQAIDGPYRVYCFVHNGYEVKLTIIKLADFVVFKIHRWNSNWHCYQSLHVTQFQDFRLHSKWGIAATSKKKLNGTSPQEAISKNDVVVEKKTSRTPKRAGARTRKKAIADTPEEISELEVNSDFSDDENTTSASDETTQIIPRRSRRKGPTNILFHGSSSLSLNILDYIFLKISFLNK